MRRVSGIVRSFIGGRAARGGVVELYIDGAEVVQITGVNTSYYGKATSVLFSLSSAASVQNSLEIYADSCKISQTYIGQ